MIRCGKCGLFYEEVTHGNCPKCGEKVHISVGKCMLCGKETERGDVCSKCVVDYRIRAEEIMTSPENDEGVKYKPSKRAAWLHAIAGFLAVISILVALGMMAFSEEFGNVSMTVIFVELCVGLFSCFLLKCYAEHLEYMEHMTKQLEEIKEILRSK